jgi:hypothetical protein
LYKIKTCDIIAINKRQIYKEDIFCFSIYFKNKNKKIQEIKIRASSTREADIWIDRLRIYIEPLRYKFDFRGKNSDFLSMIEYIETEKNLVANKNIMIINFRSEPKKYFIVLKNLEYIINRKKIILFFEIIRPDINSKYDENSDSKSYNEKEISKFSQFNTFEKEIDLTNHNNSKYNENLQDSDLAETLVYDNCLCYVNTSEITLKLSDEYLDNKLPTFNKETQYMLISERIKKSPNRSLRDGVRQFTKRSKISYHSTGK